MARPPGCSSATLIIRSTPSANLHRLTVADADKLMNVSRRMVFNAGRVLRNGCAALVAEVEAGRMSVNLALQIARFNHPSQRLILEAIEGLASREKTALVRALVADATAAK